MSQTTKTMSDVLRAAIEDSKQTFLELERATGVQRASIMRFVRGERSLRLDLADKLATYLGIECRPIRRRKA